MQVSLVAKTEEEMIEIGSFLSEALNGHGAIHISGDLGAGKTTLCRGILRAMGHEGAVKSPTFTLVEPYQITWRGKAVDVFHFDLYRLSDPGELDYVGVDEYFRPDSLCLIEWPEKASGCLPTHDLHIWIDVSGEKRIICVTANTVHGEKVCEQLPGKT
jgi:tRNA threonylcarbamoyladenosine biosynthesis protein TsaE